jgi:hypothetical protein
MLKHGDQPRLTGHLMVRHDRVNWYRLLGVGANFTIWMATLLLVAALILNKHQPDSSRADANNAHPSIYFR